MQTPAQKAELARRNGALSKGPTTAAGKARSCRNALVHGRRAGKLAEFVPPESALLSNEDRRKFFTLFDQNLAKYQPADAAEKAVVREVTDLQWANFRIAAARQSLLNRELANHQDTAIAYEAAFMYRSMTALRHEYAANARLIAQGERRLKQMQREWPTSHPEVMTADEGTNAPPPQPIANTEEPQNLLRRRIRCNGPLTAEVIAKYRKLYPNCDLTFFDGDENEQTDKEPVPGFGTVPLP